VHGGPHPTPQADLSDRGGDWRRWEHNLAVHCHKDIADYFAPRRTRTLTRGTPRDCLRRAVGKLRQVRRAMYAACVVPEGKRASTPVLRCWMSTTANAFTWCYHTVRRSVRLSAPRGLLREISAVKIQASPRAVPSSPPPAPKVCYRAYRGAWFNMPRDFCRNLCCSTFSRSSRRHTARRPTSMWRSLR
jgi:hypothetical protein